MNPSQCSNCRGEATSWVKVRHGGKTAPLPLFSSKQTFADAIGTSVEGHFRTSAKIAGYSITSSARVSNVCGTLRPSALAVFRLMTNSYLVGACTGRLAGLSPFRMRST
jgi:hypothetical protein